MKDRLIGMVGTLGLVLVLSVGLSVTDAFASGGRVNGCSGDCDIEEREFGPSICGDPRLHTCSGTRSDTGNSCGCVNRAAGGCPCS